MQSSMAQSKKKGMRFYAFIRTTASWSLTPPSFLKDTGKAYVMKFGLFLFLKKKQVRRAMKRSGITRKEVLMRIRRQMPLVEKRKMADVIIDNSQTLEALYEQVDQAL